jgi:hypothetical protein
MQEGAVPAAVYICSEHQQQQQQCSLAASSAGAVARPVVHAGDIGYADVLLAAPAVVEQQHTMSYSAFQQQQQQQQQTEVLALLPAHQVLLSGCGYFEALFSQRWHRSGYQPEPRLDSNSDSSSMDEARSELASSPNSSSSKAAQSIRRLQVVLVPEADIHVAAALQHWLYTGELQIELPQRTTAAVVPQQQQQVEQGGMQTVQLNGCSPVCHTCRTLLRLWRCADLLLLPQLQEQCLAAVEVAAVQLLPCCCCLTLLQDCCQLGVPPAADYIISGLLARFGEFLS